MSTKILNTIDVELLTKIFSVDKALVFVLNDKDDFKTLTGYVAKNREEKLKFCVVNNSTQPIGHLFKNCKNVCAMVSVAPEIDYPSFAAINNPDGSIRWLYPTESKNPTFLNLYNSNNAKGRAFKFGVNTLYKLGFKGLIKHRRLYVKIHPDSLAHNLIEKYQNKFSIFTGTVGPNRKLVVESTNKNGEKLITKVPLSNQSQFLIDNEKRTLLELKRDNEKYVAPLVVNNELNNLTITNIAPTHKISSAELSNLHVNVLTRMYDLNKSGQLFFDGEFYNKVLQQLDSIRRKLNADWINKNVRITALLLLKLDELSSNNSEVPLSLMHGDFTPWNMFVDNKKLYIYDWELSVNDSPVFIDLLHYVFQYAVMVKHANWQQIKLDLIALKKLLLSQLKQHNIDFNQLLHWYLMYYVSYYLNIYSIQNKLHYQAENLLIVWQQALREILSKERVFPKLEELLLVG